MQKRVAIIGSRDITHDTYNYLRNIAEDLTKAGHIVTTGAAEGSDTAAMFGAARGNVSNLHIFLPWKGFNKDNIPEGANVTVYNKSQHPEWAHSVHEYHPNAMRLNRGPFSLHARNYGIVAHPIPVDAVIAVPRTSGDLGGTGQGMRIAEGMGITLFNLKNHGLSGLEDWLESIL